MIRTSCFLVIGDQPLRTESHSKQSIPLRPQDTTDASTLNQLERLLRELILRLKLLLSSLFPARLLLDPLYLTPFVL